MANNTKENLDKDRDMEKVFCYLKMGLNTRDYLYMVRCTEKGYLNGLMGESIEEATKIINYMALEFILGLMVGSI